MTPEKIGFVGQGFIGRHMADDFESRGFAVVRYALEAPYKENSSQIAQCDIVFIAVPTPTTPAGFDSSALEAVLPLVGEGKIAVIKSTMLPGTTKRLQAQFPEIVMLHNPEFLREKTAKEDTKQPARTIIGLPVDDKVHHEAAQRAQLVLPTSPYQLVCTAEEAELIKYGGNCFLALKIVFMNMLYDAAHVTSADYAVITDAMKADARIGTSHMNVIDQSGHPGSVLGRGAGGHCFPKDVAALAAWYEENTGDEAGAALWRAIETKNNELLRGSNKDLDLLQGIYGF